MNYPIDINDPTERILYLRGYDAGYHDGINKALKIAGCEPLSIGPETPRPPAPLDVEARKAVSA